MTSEIIVSVPHSGTRFLQERLGVEKYVHTTDNWVHLHKRVLNKKIIVPLRRPHKVWRSWCRRRPDKNPLIWSPHYFAAYYILHTLDQMYDLDFICVDKQDDPRITDWSPVGESDASHAGWKLHEVDLRVLYKIPYVHKYYPSHLK